MLHMAKPGKDWHCKAAASKYYGIRWVPSKCLNMHKRTQLTKADVSRMQEYALKDAGGL